MHAEFINSEDRTESEERKLLCLAIGNNKVKETGLDKYNH